MMFRETNLTIEPIESIYGDPREMRQQIVELERHNKALKATVRLLDKCLTEASEDRDRYKAQLDKLNASFDDYIKREKIIKDAEESTKRFEKKLRSGFFDTRTPSEKAADEFERLLDSGFFDDNQAIKGDVLNKVHGKAMTVEEYLGGKTIEKLKEEWIG